METQTMITLVPGKVAGGVPARLPPELQFYTEEPRVEPVGPWAETAALGSRSAEISRDIWRDLGLTGMTCGHPLFPSRTNKNITVEKQ